jgi:hypothetical protein
MSGPVSSGKKEHHPSFLAIRRVMDIQRHDGTATAELTRLRQRGLIQWRAKRMEWAMLTAHAQGIHAVVAKEAFRPSV